MNLWPTFFVYASAVGLVGLAGARSIPPNDVVPFDPVSHNTISGFAAHEFRPVLFAGACQPYPAVNAAGETSAGIEPTGGMTEGCEGSPHGTQIYARSIWHNELYGIMYGWYFTKNQRADNQPGRKHCWENLVVWLNNPAVDQPIIKAVSIFVGNNYDIEIRDPATAPSSGPEPETCVAHLPNSLADNYFALKMESICAGTPQTLITWENMTDLARLALNTTDFGEHAKVPFNDTNFLANLESAYPNL